VKKLERRIIGAEYELFETLGVDIRKLEAWKRNQDFDSWALEDKELLKDLLTWHPISIRLLIDQFTWSFTRPFFGTLFSKPFNLEEDIPQIDYPDSPVTSDLDFIEILIAPKLAHTGLRTRKSISAKPSSSDQKPLSPSERKQRLAAIIPGGYPYRVPGLTGVKISCLGPLKPSIDGTPLLEFYNQRKSSISPDILRSNKKVDQFLVALTIRLAQKGNEEAANILQGCYKPLIDEIAYKFYEKYCKGRPIGSSYGLDDIKNIAYILWRKRLTGDSGEILYDALCRPQTKKEAQSLKKIKEVFGKNINEKDANAIRIDPETIDEWLITLNKLTRRLWEKYTGCYDKGKNQYKLGIQHNRIYNYRAYVINRLLNGELPTKILHKWAWIESALWNTTYFVVRDPDFNRKMFTPRYISPPYHRNLTTFLFGKSKTYNDKFFLDVRSALWRDLKDWYSKVTKSYNLHLSLDKKISPDSDITFGDVYGDPASTSLFEQIDLVKKLKSILPEEEFNLFSEVRSRFNSKGKTQKEVAIELGVNQSTVSRRYQKIKLKIKESLD
jgi:hypothetical protein